MRWGWSGRRWWTSPRFPVPVAQPPPGIPKFYRWISERYPMINQPGATIIPIIDNLYLDMNGIIHNCTHGNREDEGLSEDEMVQRIFNYLDKIFEIIKPQKLLFMAVDGAGGGRGEGGERGARRRGDGASPPVRGGWRLRSVHELLAHPPHVLWRWGWCADRQCSVPGPR